MNKVIELIQNNIYVNSFKNAINKVAFLNIGIAFFVLIFKGLEKAKFIPNTITKPFESFYLLAMVFFAVILINSIVNEILTEEKETIKISIVFMSFSFILPLMESPNLIPAFPIIGSLAAYVIIALIKNINWFKFKGSDSIPQAATNYFNVLIPIISLMIISFVILSLFSIYHQTFFQLYLALIAVMSHLVVMLIIISLICLFWYMGLHGVAVVSSVMRPFWFQMMLFNTYYVIVDAPLPYIGTETFLQWFVWLGGSGATLGLGLSLRYFAKSQQLKHLGKNSFNSGLHNINESVIFGTPIVQNKYMRIPFFATPIVLSLIAYVLISKGFIPNFGIVSPWVLPIPIGAFISSLGSWKTLVMSFALIFVSWLIYFPFFKIYDNKLVEEEAKQ